MVTLTRPAETDFDAVVVCDYCLKPAVARHVVSLSVHGVTLDLCGTDVRYLARRPLHERVRALRYLVRTYRPAQPLAPAGGDGDDPDGGPAPAAPAARSLSLALVAAHAGPCGLELSPEEEAALADFEQAVAESRDPEPCARCGRVASPGVETDAGTYCLTCGEGSDAPPEALAALRTWRLWRTCARIQAAAVARTLTAAGVS